MALLNKDPEYKISQEIFAAVDTAEDDIFAALPYAPEDEEKPQ